VKLTIQKRMKVVFAINRISHREKFMQQFILLCLGAQGSHWLMA